MSRTPPRGTRVGEQDDLGRRWSGARWVTYDTLVKKLKLSPEVAAYLDARDMEWPSHAPLIKTPEPRTVPDAAFSFARVDRVIEALKRLRHTQGKLAGQPLMPDPWQVAYFIAPVFGWVKPGGGPDGFVRIIRNATLDVPRKNGKALALSTPLLTTRGWTTMGDVQAGEYVYGPDGQPTRIEYTSTVFEDHDCYEVEFDDGQRIIADAEHLWTFFDRYRQRDVTVTTAQAVENYILPSRSGRQDRRYRVDVTAPVQRPDTDLPIDPYQLGVWLGDGATNAARITSADPEVVDAFSDPWDVAKVTGTEIDWSIRGGFLKALRELGVLGEKHIPDIYMLASEEQRLHLLRGLMDSDGCVIGTGTNTPRCEFTSTLEPLAEQVLELIRSLGWKATKRDGWATLNGRRVSRKHRVSFNAYSDRSPFALGRKSSRLVPRPARRPRSMSLQVVAIRPVRSVPTRCIKVDRADGLFLAGRGLATTHNSTISGGLALYLTAADGEMGAQVVAAASTKDQAGFTFEPVKQLAERAPALKGHVKPFKTRITHPKSGSYFQVIASSADAQHGANLHGGIIDEIHIHKNGALIEAIETGTGSREQPLIIKITTADEGKPNTPYATNRDYLEKIARGVFRDPARYGAIFAAEDKADPFVEETWAAANPGYPVSPTRAFMEDKANEARHNPIALASFKRLHLGIRTRQRTQFISTSEWRLNSGGPLDERNLEGRVAYGGLDLASVSDLTALCWLFPREDAEPGYEALWRFWVPEEAVEALDERTSGAASRVWVPRGWLSTTPGNVTDYDWVKKQILEDAEKFDVQSIGLDRWNSTQLSNDLMEEDVPILKVGQGMASMSPALKEVQRLVKMGASGRPADRVPRLRHGGNPVMTWNVDNLAVDVDPAGNVKPSKSNSADKIDGVAALCDAMFAALHAPPAPASAYEEHGVRAV